ncbi:hypothetical protein [Virgibacillus sp. YIM 98842]|uniref:hypothetical protein n=1 Tax=Virgibacillus sp. YIM 98842 TaxID=2663533 RepID=UPI0013DD39FD|nr:hypothetical protein [Virgibacillus sp. YIM 98842]
MAGKMAKGTSYSLTLAALLYLSLPVYSDARSLKLKRICGITAALCCNGLIFINYNDENAKII